MLSTALLPTSCSSPTVGERQFRASGFCREESANESARFALAQTKPKLKVFAANDFFRDRLPCNNLEYLATPSSSMFQV